MRTYHIRMALLTATAVVLTACSADRAGTIVQSDGESPLACATDLGATLADVRDWLGVAADGSGDATVNVIDLRLKSANNLFFFTDGKDLVCGSPFDDSIDSSHQTSANQALVGPGDVMLGGDGNDSAYATFGGVFWGGGGDDSVKWVAGGRFEGGDGNDSVTEVVRNGTFAGGAGDDTAKVMWGGPYDGGDGTDSVTEYVVGPLVSVENCTPSTGSSCP